MIYATQRTVAADGDPNVVLGRGTSLPARSVLLDAFIISSSNSNTNATVRQADITYSIPYGASLGLLVNKKSSFTGGFSTAATDVSGSFYLPTDRLIRVSLQASLSSFTAYKFDNTKYCEAVYDVYVDSIKRFSWSSVGLHQAWAEQHWSDTLILTKGSHTYSTTRYRDDNTGAPLGTPVARGGAILQFQDIGPSA